jgi:hypothetical protein
MIMLPVAVPYWHSTLHQIYLRICSEHARMHIVFRYGRKAKAVMLLPSIMHLLNYDYVSLMLSYLLPLYY